MKKQISLAIVGMALAIGTVVYANMNTGKPAKQTPTAQKECCSPAKCTPSASCPTGACTPDQCKDIPGCVCPK